MGWDQLVLGRTHGAAHRLDLILTRSGSLFVSDVLVSVLVSDHHLVSCSMGFFRLVKEKKTFSFRNNEAIDLDSLQEDLSSLPLITSPACAHGDQVTHRDHSSSRYSRRSREPIHGGSGGRRVPCLTEDQGRRALRSRTMD
jgi:hypothetical protein